MIEASLHLFWLQLQQPWTIASRLGKQGRGIDQRGICLLKLHDEQGTLGYGEAAPVQTYGEDLVSVLGFLRQFDWSKLSFDDPAASLDFLSQTPANHSARCAIELALLDGASKRLSTPVSDLLGIPRQQKPLPPTSYSIGIGEPEQTRQAAIASNNFPIIKLKTGPSGLEATLQTFRSVRPHSPIRIDANEAWVSKELALHHIEQAAGYGPVEFVEQPMPRDATLGDLQWLKQRSPLPLLADESFRTLEDIERCRAGFHGVNVKLVKSGGPAQAARLINAAKENGLKIQLGCMIESSLGIAAALQLAPLADWLDLDGALLTRNDPFSGVVERSGHLSFALPKPILGLGIAPRTALFQQAAPQERAIANRATIPFQPEQYGRSINGLPLEVYLPATGQCDILIFAAIHGEEPETTALLSKALRTLDAPSPRCACVLNANPDGTLLGTRCNARGVELNRNFPSSNWRTGTVSTKWAPDHGRVDFSTGHAPGSEPETQALIRLVTALRPTTIIALHAPLACIEDPQYSPLGYRLAKAGLLPLVGDIGYETPGSFGSWAKENGCHVITYELPPISVSAMHSQHLLSLTNLLKHGLESEKKAER